MASITLQRDPLDLPPFDQIIDVRSPAEFAEDHMPGAVSLPVLNDAERAQVGTLYVQVSRFQARRIGAALVARNIAGHLLGPLADKPKGWRPLVYCWRGGQRSGAMAHMLSRVGWDTAVLDGGYRSYRRAVHRGLYQDPLPHRFVLADGMTGCGKTAILQAAAAQGAQVLDLEALARHRGSIFGLDPADPQPPQKMFESAVWAALRSMDPARPVLAEAESSSIGAINLPAALWRAMQVAPRIEITAPTAARAAFQVQTYGPLVRDGDRLARLIDRLRPYHSRDRVAQWQALAAAGDLHQLALQLMASHYDPAYGRSRGRTADLVADRIALAGLSQADVAGAAAGLINRAQRLMTAGSPAAPPAQIGSTR